MKENPLFTIKFIKAVENHPCLWNYSLKDYYNKDVISRAWNSIAEECQDSEQICRDRWRNIRCAFVRTHKPLPPGSTKSKKTYYLADHMSFLIPYMSRHLRNTFPSSSEYTDESLDPQPSISAITSGIYSDSDVLYADELHEEDSSHPLEQKFFIHENSVSNANSEAADSGTVEWTNENQNKEEEADLLFLRSLIPDIQKLDDKRKRTFKRKIISLLDQLIDETELSQTSSYSKRSIPSSSTSQST